MSRYWGAALGYVVATAYAAAGCGDDGDVTPTRINVESPPPALRIPGNDLIDPPSPVVDPSTQDRWLAEIAAARTFPRWRERMRSEFTAETIVVVGGVASVIGSRLEGRLHGTEISVEATLVGSVTTSSIELVQPALDGQLFRCGSFRFTPGLRYALVLEPSSHVAGAYQVVLNYPDDVVGFGVEIETGSDSFRFDSGPSVSMTELALLGGP